MFAGWGRLVYRIRWLTLVASLLFLTGSAIVLTTLRQPPPNSSSSSATQSARADELISQQTRQNAPAIDLVFSSASLQVNDAAFQSAMQSALAPLRGDSRVESVSTPYTTSGAASAAMRSRNGHEGARDRDAEKQSGPRPAGLLGPALAGELSSAQGERHRQPGHRQDFTSYLSHDLHNTSNVVFVVAIVLLLIVFGTLVASGLPLLIAVAAEVAGLAFGVNVLGQFTDVSIYATNLIALIGLGVALDLGGVRRRGLHLRPGNLSGPLNFTPQPVEPRSCWRCSSR